MRILIADDHAVVRQGLIKILADQFGPAIFGEAEDGRAALDLLTKHSWDAVILDISLPDMSGLDVLRELRQQRLNIPALILSMHAESQYAVRALRAGAAGYLTKQSNPEELVKAVRRVVSGGKYLSPALAEALAIDLGRTGGNPLHETLSDREFQVMCMIASGKSVKEAAERLSLSPKTVSTYRARILEKLKVKTTAELILYAVQNGLVPALHPGCENAYHAS
ncbi:MAG: response regulator transcription factor [Acidobacteria bacterium]|nr:response regulator transcription factor [Acidobacteriota bacterium]